MIITNKIYDMGTPFIGTFTRSHIKKKMTVITKMAIPLYRRQYRSPIKEENSFYTHSLNGHDLTYFLVQGPAIQIRYFVPHLDFVYTER